MIWFKRRKHLRRICPIPKTNLIFSIVLIAQSGEPSKKTLSAKKMQVFVEGEKFSKFYEKKLYLNTWRKKLHFFSSCPLRPREVAKAYSGHVRKECLFWTAPLMILLCVSRNTYIPLLYAFINVVFLRGKNKGGGGGNI